MGEQKEAVVVGASGVIGRYIVERLLRQEDCSVIGLSRRAADAAPRYRHISVDLLDREDAAAKLAGLTEAIVIAKLGWRLREGSWALQFHSFCADAQLRAIEPTNFGPVAKGLVAICL